MFLFLLFLLLLPATMIGFGFRWSKNPPKAMNSICGYRTTWSMKTQDTWDFAHRYAGNVWLKLGIPIGILSIASWGILGLTGIGVMVVYLQIAGLLSVIIPTEIALRKNFDENGKRKENVK